MPFINDRVSQIAWLSARLASNRNRISSLWRRLRGLGPPGSLQPAIFAKFSHWLNEVAAAKDEEMNLMTRIENIEREHRDMRVSRKLKRATSRPETTDDYPCYEPKGGWSFRTLLWLLVVWHLFMRQKINQKKQGLTAD